MGKWLTMAAAAMLVASCATMKKPAVPEPKLEPSWVTLFNGKNLDGWIKRGGKATYRVEDGAIVGTTAQDDTVNTFLCTEKEYGDFMMEIDFKVDDGLNSGVQLRSSSRPEYQEGRVHGLQVEIDPAARAWTGGIQEERGRSWQYDLKENEVARKAFKHNEWNHFTIVAVGDTYRTWLNGVPAANLHDTLHQTGFLALQVHHVKSEKPLEVRFKNIKLLPLDQNGLPKKEGTARLAAGSNAQGAQGGQGASGTPARTQSGAAAE